MSTITRHPSQIVKPPGAVSIATDCFECAHYRLGGSCPAYPDEIPDEIFRGYVQHDVVLPGQTGEWVFEAPPDLEVQWLDADGNPLP